MPITHKLMRISFIFILLLIQSFSASAKECKTVNLPSTMALIELYTSEGCSSCPPADIWLNKISERFNEKEVIAIAFHVDYWDRLGWKDPFSQAAFSDRQRYMMAIQKSRFVYTPEIMLQGKEFRKWSSGNFAEAVEKINHEPSAAEINLELLTFPDKLEINTEVVLQPNIQKDNLGFYLAMTENQLTNQITAGENKGKTLTHSHVVRQLIGPLSLNTKERYSAKLAISNNAYNKIDNTSIVGFIQDLRNGNILQAVELKPCF